MRQIIATTAALVLGACTAAQEQQAVSTAQVLCNVQTVAGPVVNQLVSVTDPAIAPAEVEADALTNQACAAIAAKPPAISGP